MSDLTDTHWTDPIPFDEYTAVFLMGGVESIGDVQWFLPGGPYYPHLDERRFGAFENLESAKRRVEQAALQSVTATGKGE